MRTNVRRMVDQIDEFLATAPHEDVQDLWNLLAALRGPDVDPTGDLKSATTAVIRRKMFPKAGGRLQLWPGVEVAPQDREFQLNLGVPWCHFTRHADWAHKALEHEDDLVNQN